LRLDLKELALFLVSWLWVLDMEDELKELALFLVSWLWVLGVKDLELVQWALGLKLKELALFLVSWS
jgi:hypothetical protein